MTKRPGKPSEHRLADMSISPPPEQRWLPYRLPANDESYQVDLLGSRIHHATWFDGGQITDFVMSQQVQGSNDDEEWIDIVRIDCCHSEVHVHYFGADEIRKIIRPITSPEDVRLGLVEAETLIYDDWQENLRRWEHGRR